MSCHGPTKAVFWGLDMHAGPLSHPVEVQIGASFILDMGIYMLGDLVSHIPLQLMELLGDLPSLKAG
jgi:hypothetical protein